MEKSPKEEAKELVDIFTTVGLQQRNEGIACALIHAELLIDVLAHDLGHDATAQGLLSKYEEVKKEIQNL